MPSTSSSTPVSIGISGLDDILGGGLPSGRVYLLRGTPGVGKTTFGFQFLLEGVRRGEPVVYVSLSESHEELEQIFVSHGWSLDGITIFDLLGDVASTGADEENTVYATQDVDLRDLVHDLMREIDRVRPTRVVFDSVSEIRLLAGSAMTYRRQMLQLKRLFAPYGATVLLIDDNSATHRDLQLETIAHGVIDLQLKSMEYGADRRRLRISKLRGRKFRSGYHDFLVDTGGARVFPRLVAAEHRTSFSPVPLTSGLPSLDALLGGGLDRGTATLLLGPAGSGKSVITTQFACAAASAGVRTAMFVFEERLATMYARTKGLGLDIESHVLAGRVIAKQIDPAELAPDEFTHLVREAINSGVEFVVIDSINGYYNAMPEARALTLQMHELLAFAAEKGVATLLTLAQTGIATSSMRSPVDISYLTDAIIALRYFEMGGRVRKAISVLKKRSGTHEDSIRELILTHRGIQVSAPLQELRGILSGIPEVVHGLPDQIGRDS